MYSNFLVSSGRKEEAETCLAADPRNKYDTPSHPERRFVPGAFQVDATSRRVRANRLIRKKIAFGGKNRSPRSVRERSTPQVSTPIRYQFPGSPERRKKTSLLLRY